MICSPSNIATSETRAEGSAMTISPLNLKSIGILKSLPSPSGIFTADDEGLDFLLPSLKLPVQVLSDVF
jgi:hypothetical protein